MEQDPLFLIFLYLRELHSNVYWGILIQTIEGYEEGPKLWGLLA